MADNKQKPFTGLVGEIAAIPFLNHCGWDQNPSSEGSVTKAEPGEAMKRNAAQRAQAEQNNED